MTNGTVVVLGSTGRNFAAGMSGGLAYVLDKTGEFSRVRCNKSGVDLESIFEPDEVRLLESLVRKHVDCTGSPLGQRIQDSWPESLRYFVKVYPHEFKRVLKLKETLKLDEKQPAALLAKAASASGDRAR